VPTCARCQTKNCDPNGQREPANDKQCDQSIPHGNSGFCECTGGVKRQLANCSHGVLPSCAQVCEATQPPSPPPAGCDGCEVFITSGAGGTGHVAIQIAKAWGATVTAVGGTADAYFMLRLGADKVVDYQAQSNIFAGIPQNSIDIVYDNFGAPGTADLAMPVLKPSGTFIFLPGKGGAISAAPKQGVRQIDYGLLNPGDHSDLDALSALVENGQLKPHVQTTFSIDGEIPAAFKVSQAGSPMGNYLLIDRANARMC
jgi:NADPH:quinone reductase-like Zn-dependent oxidoreductase